ncbi:DMT family transporter [Halopseudomonas phragmitis]|uniref:EamA family transporter n=2 Tax=Pseudomonadaceae TaxID=135621 RepID=A0A1V0B790_9GAMM|nr:MULTISPECIES: DMT family transporter [Pseudomonadaceae]AQZ95806.1 EamA family transporter [Halopseudomonas phragmitis]PAU88710.1 EamA/RhaT family transporter [Pseudomonas sp. WN033]RHW21455.1 EamA/RhaT family transporter [Pseudomonas jilinensis]
MTELPRTDLPRKGALLLAISALLFALMGVLIREVSSGVNNETVVFFRNLVGVFFFLPMILVRGFGPFRTQRLGNHFLRTFYGLGAMYCFFYAIAHLPLADAMVFTYAAPVFTPILAWWWLKESLTGRMMFMVLLGFAGVLLVAKPSGALFDPKGLVGIGASLLAACAFVSIRAMSNSEPASRIVFYFSTFSALLSAIPLIWAWQPLTLTQLAMLVAIGLVATTSQLVMSKAYALAPPGKIGPLSYLAIVFSGLFAWLLWSEVPGLSSWLGAGLIFASTLISLTQPAAKTK